MIYFYLVILFILGALMICKPELLWKIEYMFTVKDGEPTELYITLMRLFGVFLILCSIVVLLISILK